MIELIRGYETFFWLAMALSLGVGFGSAFLLFLGVASWSFRFAPQLPPALRRRERLAGLVVCLTVFGGGILTFSIGISSYERFGIANGWEATIVSSIAVVTILIGAKCLFPKPRNLSQS